MSNTSITGECFLTLAWQFYDLQRQIYGSTDDWDEDDNYSDVLDCLYTYGWKFYDRLNLLYIISVIKHQQIKFDGEPDFILEKESGDPVSNMQTFCHSDIKLKLLYGICTAYGWDCLIPDTDDFGNVLMFSRMPNYYPNLLIQFYYNVLQKLKRLQRKLESMEQSQLLKNTYNHIMLMPGQQIVICFMF